MTSRRWILGLAGVAALALLPALLFTFRSSEQTSAAFTPPTDRNYVAIDCNTGLAGIQSSCNVVSGQSLDVGIVVGVGSAVPGPIEIGALQFTALADQAKLSPKTGVDANLNANPDFNDAGITGTWSCTPPAPNRDQDPSPSVAASFLACVTGAQDGPSIASGGTATVAVVHYDALAAGSTQLNLAFAVMGNDQFLAFADCNPNTDTNASCFPAIVTIEEPDIDFSSNVLLDCDTDPGVQSTCFLPTGTTSATVDVVFENLSGGDVVLGAYNFNVLGNNQTLFTPAVPACPSPGTNCNPDMQLTAAGWACSPPSPNPDSDPSPTSTSSFISCFNGTGDGETVPDGGFITLARVTMNVSGTGTGTFTLADVGVSDTLVIELHSCNPGVYKCVNASITIGSPPTPTAQAATSTPTNTVAAATSTNTATATSTRTNTPTNTPVPATSTNTPTNTATNTATATNTVPANTSTPTNTATATNTVPANTSTPTNTATSTVPANTATNTPTATNTVPADTATSTSTPTETSTSVPTATDTVPADTATNTPTATPTVPTPAAAWTVRFDCDVVASGIQNDCTLAGGVTSAAIDVVVENVSEDPGRRLGAFNFIVVGDNRPVFTPFVPGACAAPGLDCNPDFNQGMGGAGWSCAPPNPNPDLDPDVDPATSHSVISCFNGASDGPVLGVGQSVPLGRVTYTINGTGQGVFTPGTTNVYDDLGVDLLSCAVEGACFPATIRTAAGEPTATNTQVNTATATNTVPADTATATNTVPADTATATNTVPANTATPTNTVAPATATNTAQPTSTSTPVATATNTAEPTATNTAEATVEATGTVEVTRTVVVTRTVTITKTAGVTETPGVETETPAPSETPGVTETPSTNTPTATNTVATSTSTAQPSVTATKPASTHTPTSTATRPSGTATTAASTATRESTVAAIATSPSSGSGGASALPDAGQGGSGGASNLTVAVLSIAAAGVGLYGVVAMKRRRTR